MFLRSGLQARCLGESELHLQWKVIQIQKGSGKFHRSNGKALGGSLDSDTIQNGKTQWTCTNNQSESLTDEKKRRERWKKYIYVGRMYGNLSTTVYRTPSWAWQVERSGIKYYLEHNNMNRKYARSRAKKNSCISSSKIIVKTGREEFHSAWKNPSKMRKCNLRTKLAEQIRREVPSQYSWSKQ